MKLNTSRSFIIISPDDDENEIKRKLNSPAKYIVSFQGTNKKIQIQHREIAQQIFSKAGTVQQFNQVFNARSHSVFPVTSMAQAAASRQNIVAFMQ